MHVSDQQVSLLAITAFLSVGLGSLIRDQAFAILMSALYSGGSSNLIRGNRLQYSACKVRGKIEDVHTHHCQTQL